MPKKGKELKTCSSEMSDGKPCGRTLHDDEHCIFHSKDIEGKKKKFKDEFWKEFERQKKSKNAYDFTRFVFPDDISFEKIEFEKDANILYSTFSGEANFVDSKFSGVANFRFSTFSGVANFRSATFSGGAHFEPATFSGEANFVGSTFSGEANFWFAKFSGEAHFESATFSGEASFQSATFSGEARFERTKFFSNVNYSNTKFSEFVNFGQAQFFGDYTYFNGSKFSEYANFALVHFFGETIFRRAIFSGEADFQNIEIAGFDKWNMMDTILRDVRGLLDFIELDHKKKDIKNKTKFEEELRKCREEIKACKGDKSGIIGRFDEIRRQTAKYKKFNYSHKTDRKCKKILPRWWPCKTHKAEFLPEKFRLILGDYATAKYPLVKRQIQDDIYLIEFQKKHPCWHFLWCLTADCGRSFLRWAAWCLIIAVIFSVIFSAYYSVSPSNFQAVYVNEWCPWFSFFYYSVVTFTTLGFGDIVPKCGWLQLWVMLEVILGYVMLGGLISILANKLARRS